MEPYYKGMCGELYHGDVRSVLKELPDKSVHCCVTSPPYFGLRDYGVDGQLGLEKTPEKFVNSLVNVFHEVKRVLRDDGTVWLNLGDSYNADGRDGHGTRTGHKQGTNRASATGQDNNRPTDPALKQKDLIGIPWRVAFALQADGWYLRQDIIWHKTNPMPESVRDRCTKAHEYIFLLSKSAKYYYDYEAIKEPAKWERWGDQTVSKKQQGTAKWIGNKSKEELQSMGTKNKRSVWTVSTKPFKGAHFAVFPPDLIEPCVLAGCPEGGTVLDPFMGSGTTALVAGRHNRRFAGIELNRTYLDEITIPRIKKEFDSILD